MTGRLRYIFLAGLMLCFICPVVLLTDNGAMATVISKPSKRVLLLYSYQAVQPINLIWDAAIRAALRGPAEDPLEFYTEYLDLSQFPDETHRQRLLNFLKEKYAGRQMDLVIPLGEFAFRFLLSHRDFLFPGEPPGILRAAEKGPANLPQA